VEYQLDVSVGVAQGCCTPWTSWCSSFPGRCGVDVAPGDVTSGNVVPGNVEHQLDESVGVAQGCCTPWTSWCSSFPGRCGGDVAPGDVTSGNVVPGNVEHQLDESVGVAQGGCTRGRAGARPSQGAVAAMSLPGTSPPGTSFLGTSSTSSMRVLAWPRGSAPADVLLLVLPRALWRRCRSRGRHLRERRSWERRAPAR